MRKKYIKITLLLSSVLLILSILLLMGYTIYLNKTNKIINSNIIVIEEKYDEDNPKYDILEKNDESYKDKNNIDIVNKYYAQNIISVSDSDFDLSSELKNSIYSTINSFSAASSFYLVNLDKGMSIGYNIDKAYQTASSIKAPYALWLYEEIEKGNISLNDTITYKSRDYNKGSGIIKNNPFGTTFTTEELIKNSLIESDNVAHTMLHRTYGVTGYNDFLNKLGTKQLYLSAASPWGLTSCRSAALIWQEIYNFSLRSEYGIKLMNILTKTKYNYYKDIIPKIESASKTGFANYDVVQTGIIFGNHPYIAIAIANTGGNKTADSQILRLITLMTKIEAEYEEYLKET